MTTDNIKSVQITLTTDTGDMLVGTTSDSILVDEIASYVKFVKMDKANFVSFRINELMGNNNTPSTTNQTPHDCKHFDQWKCTAHGKEHPCVFASELAKAFALDCKDYESKEYKQPK